MKYPNIEAERARNGLTVESLTKKLNVCRKTYYNWINCGKIPPSKLEEMAELFGVSTDYLFGNEKMFYDVFLLLCHEQNISPSKAAQEIGFNKASVTNWKNNGYTPREEILNKIATYFDVSVDYLLGRTNEKIPFKTTKKGAKAEMTREMEIEFEGCKFKLVKQKPEVPDEQFVRIDDLTYPALKRYSNESGIPIDELASQMVAFAICHLVIEEYDPQKQKEKRGENR